MKLNICAWYFLYKPYNMTIIKIAKHKTIIYDNNNNINVECQTNIIQ